MRETADVKVLPPMILLGALALGLVSRFVFPNATFPRSSSRWLGIVFIVVSIVFVASAGRELAKARTAFDVRKPTTALVTTGVFRLSRNPVYLSMSSLYLGLSLLLGSVPMALLVVPLGSVLCIAVIKPEERYLGQQFGVTYDSYTAAVRRWI